MAGESCRSNDLVRFVSDDPPPALVDRVAASWQASGGDLAQVMETLLLDPEFYAERHRDSKLKTPLEFAVGALRVLPPPPEFLDFLARPPVPDSSPAARNEDSVSPEADVLVDVLQALANPYAWAAPTGWPDVPETWSSTSSVRGRMLLATLVAEHAEPLGGDMVEEAVQRVLLGRASEATRSALREAAARPGSERERSVQVLATALMSPEFQYR